LPVVVHSDWVLLGRILRNFLSNALRYSEQGSLLLGLAGCDACWWGVGSGAGYSGRQIVAGVRGIPALAEHSGMCSKGLGLGLAIVKRLATRLQHRLVVQSHYGRGSFFGIVLPYGQAEAASLFPRQQERVTSPGPSELQACRCC
jgi:signal transduction histidine kinase